MYPKIEGVNVIIKTKIIHKKGEEWWCCVGGLHLLRGTTSVAMAGYINTSTSDTFPHPLLPILFLLQAKLSALATTSKVKLIANSFTLKVFRRSHSYFFQRAQEQPVSLRSISYRRSIRLNTAIWRNIKLCAVWYSITLLLNLALWVEQLLCHFGL